LKQIEVTILGQAYRLGCPEGGEALLRTAVASVDKEMLAVRDAGKIKARERIAVLAALNLGYQLAERGPASAAAALTQASATSAASTTTEVTGTAEADIDALLLRVDDALADDGHLL